MGRDVIAPGGGDQGDLVHPERAPSPEPEAGVVELYGLEPVDVAVATIFVAASAGARSPACQGRRQKGELQSLFDVTKWRASARRR